MKNPVHPGALIRANIEELGLNVTSAAKVLHVTRPTLSKVLNGKASVSLEMAIRLSKAFGGVPDTWLKMQLAYDLAQLRRRGDGVNIKRYHAEQAGV